MQSEGRDDLCNVGVGGRIILKRTRREKVCGCGLVLFGCGGIYFYSLVLTLWCSISG